MTDPCVVWIDTTADAPVALGSALRTLVGDDGGPRVRFLAGGQPPPERPGAAVLIAALPVPDEAVRLTRLLRERQVPTWPVVFAPPRLWIGSAYPAGVCRHCHGWPVADLPHAGTPKPATPSRPTGYLRSHLSLAAAQLRPVLLGDGPVSTVEQYTDLGTGWLDRTPPTCRCSRSEVDGDD